VAALGSLMHPIMTKREGFIDSKKMIFRKRWSAIFVLYNIHCICKVSECCIFLSDDAMSARKKLKVNRPTNFERVCNLQILIKVISKEC